MGPDGVQPCGREVHVSESPCGVAKALDIPFHVVPFPECLFDWLESGPIDVLAQMGELLKRRVRLQWRKDGGNGEVQQQGSPPGMSQAPPPPELGD